MCSSHRFLRTRPCCAPLPCRPSALVLQGHAHPWAWRVWGDVPFGPLPPGVAGPAPHLQVALDAAQVSSTRPVGPTCPCSGPLSMPPLPPTTLHAGVMWLGRLAASLGQLAQESQARQAGILQHANQHLHSAEASSTKQLDARPSLLLSQRVFLHAVGAGGPARGSTGCGGPRRCGGKRLGPRHPDPHAGGHWWL